jgi:hypothetical protein
VDDLFLALAGTFCLSTPWHGLFTPIAIIRYFSNLPI